MSFVSGNPDSREQLLAVGLQGLKINFQRNEDEAYTYLIMFLRICHGFAGFVFCYRMGVRSANGY